MAQFSNPLLQLNKPTLETDQDSDQTLIARFVQKQDQAAFELLVKRYHGLVMGVCRRVLGNTADAEEAYQATFMVMARRAGSLSWYEIVAGWLHETAYKTALSQSRKRSNAKKLSNHVASFQEDPQAKELEPDRAAMLRELNTVLDEEISKLPTKYREPLLLHLFEGIERQEMAQRLGVSTGAIKDRLERGRDLLRAKLTLRGFTLSLGTLAAWFTTDSLSQAAVATTLTSTTTKAAAAFAVGGSTAGIVSGSTNSLAQGILQMYFFGKLKLYAFSSLTALVLAITAYGLIQDTGERFEKRLRGYIQSIGSNSGSTHVTILLDDTEVLLNLDVAKDVVVYQAYQKTSFERLKSGMYIGVKLGKDQRTIQDIQALGHTIEGTLVRRTGSLESGVSAIKFTVRLEEGENEVERELMLAKGAILRIGGMQASVRHLDLGLSGTFEFGPKGDLIHCIELSAESEQMIEGHVKSFDVQSKSLTVMIDIEDVWSERKFEFAADPILRIDSEVVGWNSIVANLGFRARLSAKDRTKIESIQFEASNEEPDEMEVSLENEDSPNSIDEPSPPELENDVDPKAR